MDDDPRGLGGYKGNGAVDLWGVVSGRAPGLGLGLLALGLIVAYTMGAPLTALLLGGSVGVLLVTGLLATPAGLVLGAGWLLWLVWLVWPALLPLPR